MHPDALATIISRYAREQLDKELAQKTWKLAIKILYERRLDNIDYIYLTEEASSEVSLVLYKAA